MALVYRGRAFHFLGGDYNRRIRRLRAARNLICACASSQGLANHFHARVELDTFHVSLGNGFRGEWGVWAQGHGLRIWPPAEVAGVEVPNTARPRYRSSAWPPSASTFLCATSRTSRFMLARFISQGLRITLAAQVALPAPAPPPLRTSNVAQPAPAGLPISFQLGTVDCKDADLILETSKPGKLPLEIDIARFKLSGISPNNSMHFEAELTNPKPIGDDSYQGHFRSLAGN